MGLVVGKTQFFDEAYIIRSHDELIEFLEFQQEACKDQVSYYIQNSVPADRWDHCQPICLASIHAVALMKMKMGLVAPLMAYDMALREYATQLFEIWDKKKYDYLAINMKGGHSPASAGEVSNIRAFVPKSFTFVLGTSPNMIIENDLEVDKWYIENVPKGFSYITELGKCNPDDLKQCFEEFHKVHPDGTLWIHTQAMDENLFMIWLMTARSVGIYKFKIHASVEEAWGRMHNGIEKLREIGKDRGAGALVYKLEK